MNIKTVAVIVILCLAVVFLGLDKCGSSRKADELKGKYEEASRIAKKKVIFSVPHSDDEWHLWKCRWDKGAVWNIICMEKKEEKI